jgi:hypothetical protein
VGTLPLLTAIVDERQLNAKSSVHRDFAVCRQQEQCQSPHSSGLTREGSVIVERKESVSTPSSDTAKEERFVKRLDGRTLADKL